ncbi:MAG: Sua5/YciO/YrdC/YwlC family protein [Planctomycetota bacterium]
MRQSNDAAVGEAAERLRHGQIVAVPTETVYGLAGDARSESAVSKIYSAKGRPGNNPLIVHVHSPDAALHWTDRGKWPEELVEQWDLATQLCSATGCWCRRGSSRSRCRSPRADRRSSCCRSGDGPARWSRATP